MTVLIAGFLAAAGQARALEFRDIEGKWCDDLGSYTFERNAMIMVMSNTRKRTRWAVTRYQYNDDTIVMHWMCDGKELTTTFADFTSRRMAQLPNSEGPRYDFRRC
jgi:hypothetical protein